jgi:hypothetical protein
MVWIFERVTERREFQIRKAAGRNGYEIVLRQPDGPEASEWYPDASDLISRQTAVARMWQATGWRPLMAH